MGANAGRRATRESQWRTQRCNKLRTGGCGMLHVLLHSAAGKRWVWRAVWHWPVAAAAVKQSAQRAAATCNGDNAHMSC
eukprot:14635058-Alexandrium_andersonii.AAC.1